MERYSDEGEVYEYIVSEDEVPKYTTTYNGTTIINSYNVPNTVTIVGDKVWGR